MIALAVVASAEGGVDEPSGEIGAPAAGLSEVQAAVRDDAGEADADGTAGEAEPVLPGADETGEGLSGAAGAGAAAADPGSRVLAGFATHYGAEYEGSPMGCPSADGRSRPYRGEDATIVAVSPDRDGEWYCGRELRVSGPAGSIVVTRQDSCPGCAANVLDLSEAGNALVCGAPPHTCRVTIEELDGR